MYAELKEKKHRRGKLDSEWREGIWLGHTEKSNEVLVGTPEGVVRTWAVTRRPDEERWRSEKIESMRGTPSCPVPGRTGSDIPIRIRVESGEEVEAVEYIPSRQEFGRRRLQLRKRHFEKHGFTEGCEGCRRSRIGRRVVKHRGHSEACRRRMYEAMASNAEDREWLRSVVWSRRLHQHARRLHGQQVLIRRDAT